MAKITVAGMGPGGEKQMTGEVLQALEAADILVGYQTYLDLLSERWQEKPRLSTGMTREEERCRLCFREAAEGKQVVLLCSGDAGVYGMASLLLSLADEYQTEKEKIEIEILPGVTAATSGAALLGAPINHDFCCISLSDRLTPWDRIEKRLLLAAEADLVIVLYNPASKARADYLQRACDLLLTRLEKERACGLVKNIGRAGTEKKVCTLAELRDMPADMFTTVYIGNSQTRIRRGRLVTPRGYPVEEADKGERP